MYERSRAYGLSSASGAGSCDGWMLLAADGDYRKVGNGTTTRALRFVSILKAHQSSNRSHQGHGKRRKASGRSCLSAFATACTTAGRTSAGICATAASSRYAEASARCLSARSRRSGVRRTTLNESLMARQTVRCGLRALQSCAPINWDHAREHDRKSDFCFAIGNETRNPPRPIKYGRVACAKVAKRPNHKTGCVNRPADSFGMCHPTLPRLSDAGHRRWPGRREFNRRGNKSKAPPSLRLVDRSLANRPLTLGPAQVLFREAKKLFVAAIDG